MRQFQKRSEASPSAIPTAPVHSLVRDTMRQPAEYQTAAVEIESCCVNCAPKFCMQYVEPQIPNNAPIHARRVCPTDAINFSEHDRRVEITDECIRCGLCALLCPYGAIFLTDGNPDTLPYNPKTFSSTGVDATAALLELPSSVSVKKSEIRSAIRRAVRDQQSTDKSSFYPLVGSLLTSIGLCTVVTRAGDPNNRMDAVVLDRSESMPIEIKSPTEVPYINVKAIRQAVENKIVMIARNMFPTQPGTSTLAIGYEYPNARSDVDELVEDMASVFGINVGLVSLETLFILAWNSHVCSDNSGAVALKSLRGRANATIS